MGAAGVGALVSASWLATRRTVLGLGRVIPSMAALFGGALIAFSFSHWLWLSLLLMVATGFGMMQADGRQQHCPANHRGRRQARPGHELLLDGDSWAWRRSAACSPESWRQRIGAPYTLAIGGACCIVGALWFVNKLPKIRAHIRPIYSRLGILPVMADGIQAATLHVEQEE